MDSRLVVIKVLSFFLLVLCFVNVVSSQDFNAYEERKNQISFDPLVPIFGTLQLQYERPIVKRFSLSISAGYKFSSGLFNVASVDFNQFVSEELDFKGIKLIPEIRWYVQKSHSGLSGLYLGAYYKYQNYRTDLEGEYTSTEGEMSPILIDASLKSSVVGLEVGYKLKLKRNFFIDFIIAGPGKSYNTLEMIEVTPVPEVFYDDLTETLKDLGIIDLLDPDFEINGNQKTKIELPAFRYGMKIGYAF